MKSQLDVGRLNEFGIATEALRQSRLEFSVIDGLGQRKVVTEMARLRSQQGRIELSERRIPFFQRFD